MQDRSVWSLVLNDILEVMPLRTVREAMGSMSSRDLKNTAVRVTRLDKLFDNDVIHPVKVERIACSKDAAKMHLTFGGQWVVIMHEDGSLNIHQTRDFASPFVSVAPPDCPTSMYRNDPAYVEVGMTSFHEELLVVSFDILTAVK